MESRTDKRLEAVGMILGLAVLYVLMVFTVGAFYTHISGGDWLEGGLRNVCDHYEWLTTGRFPNGYSR